MAPFVQAADSRRSAISRRGASGKPIALIVLGALDLVVGLLATCGRVAGTATQGTSTGASDDRGALLPLSCGWLLGIPIVIWTLVTLRRDDVRALFAPTSAPQGYYPPPPTQFPGSR